MHLLAVLYVLLNFLGTSLCAPHGWHVKQRASPSRVLKLNIVLNVDRAYDDLRRSAFNIASPPHVLFRKHLTPRELQDALSPSRHSLEEVQEWLSRVNLSINAVRGNVVECIATVHQVEALTGAKYLIYSDGYREIIRTETYDLTKIPQPFIKVITPMTQFPPPARAKLDVEPQFLMARDLSGRAACGSSSDTTPSCLRQLYNITYTPAPNRTTFAVYATEAASYSVSDTTKFLQKYNPPAAAAGASYTIIGNGDSSEGSPSIAGAFETHLDTQTLLGLAWPAQGILYNLGGVFGPKAGQEYDPFVQFLQDLIHNASVPSVVSFSESMPEDQVDASYAQSVCDMMMLVGLRGTTLVFSSGDNGPQGDQPTGTHRAIFEPEFPASCPWVLAVGGTTDLAAETAATQSTISGLISKLSYTASGGGFSNYFPRPDYQDPAVSAYVAAGHIPASYASKSGFDAAGRGIPDVAAMSTNFPVVWNGLTIPISGTSASTPTWAAVIALLMNPWLYSLGDGSGLRDITTGGNNVGACYLLGGCTLPETLGFDVSVGWDPVTGLGSPLFGGLVEALDALAARRKG